MFDGDYVIGVLELPAETLSDGSIDGGMGATDEPEEEIIEGKEISEAEETEDDPNLDLGLDIEGGEDLELPAEEPTDEPKEQPAVEAPLEEPTSDPSAEMPAEQMPSEEPANLTAPQKYFVVYDITGDEREEIFRCGSNNVVNAFNAFYNDTFKGSMKNAILQYKETKETEKTEAEKSEKKKVESDKQSKLKKFLGNSKSEE
jgi:hypothetical protein